MHIVTTPASNRLKGLGILKAVTRQAHRLIHSIYGINEVPATKKQMRVAGRELRLRREGKVKQEANRASAKRMMGSMSTKNLRKYAQSIDKDIAKLERRLKETGSMKHAERLLRARRQKAQGR